MATYYIRADAVGGASGAENTDDATTGALALDEVSDTNAAGDLFLLVHDPSVAGDYDKQFTVNASGTIAEPIRLVGCNSN